MLLTIEALRTQLHEQQRLGRERVAALVEDRRLRMAEVRQMHRVRELGVASLALLSCSVHTTLLACFSRLPFLACQAGEECGEEVELGGWTGRARCRDRRGWRRER